MNFFSDSILGEIRDRNDIYDVVSSYVALRKSGSNYLGLCPFHNEKTPSFSVSVSRQIFHCFGCGEGGNVISFIMKVENISFSEAVRFLAKRANIDIPDDGAEDTAKKRKLFFEINKAAAKFYHECLISDRGTAGLSYFEKRGLSMGTIKTFGLGYAPDGWDSLKNHLTSLGYKQSDLVELGICIRNKDSNSVYDRFRNRVMFPIIDILGNIIGFGGRVLDDSLPKYMNSPDSFVYNKSRNLFCMNFAKNSKKNELILAEGYMDVIALYKSGFKNVAASLGTSLTNEQARLIARFFKEVIIAYDSDTAGRAASQRAINILSEVGISVKVLNMGDKKDPDEYIKAYGSKAFERLITSSSNYIEYRLFDLASKHDLDNPEDRVKFLRGASEIIAAIPNSIEREVYKARLANTYGVSKDSIEIEVNRILHKKKKEFEQKRKRQLVGGQSLKQAGAGQEYDRSVLNIEHAIINILYNDNSLYHQVSDRLSEESFVNMAEKKMLAFMIEKFKSGEPADVALMNQHFTSAELSLFVGIISRDYEFDKKSEQLFRLIDELNLKKLKIDAFSDNSDDDLKQMQFYEKIIEKKQIKKNGENK